MPLFDFSRVGGLGAQQAQTGGLGGFMGNAFGGLGRFNERHPGLLMASGLALQGENIWPAAMYGAQVRKTKKEDAERQATEAKTRAFLKAEGFTDTQVDAAVANPTIMNRMLTKGEKDEFATRAAAAQEYGLTPEEAQEFVLTGQLSSGRFGSAEVGLQPVWGQDAEGNYVLMQPSKSGKMVQSGMPEGVKPLSPYDRKYQESSGSNAGKAQGDAMATLASMRSKMPGLMQTVTKLDNLAETATYSLGGQGVDWFNRQVGLPTRQAAVDRQEYISTVANQVLPLLRDTFGAQFTAAEGDKLLATLGDPDLSPPEKQAALRAFIEQKRRDVEALAAQTGQEAPAAVEDPLGIR